MYTRLQLHRLATAAMGIAVVLVAGTGSADPDGADPYRLKQRDLRGDCWEIHSLGTLGGPFSAAVDLNNSGQVVGNAATEPRILDSADPPYTLVRPFISAPNGGSITEIITPGYFYGSATAINEAGQVVGDSTIGRSFPISYVTDPGGNNVQPTLAFTFVRDINDVGQTLWDQTYPYFTVAIGPDRQSDLQGTDLINVDVPVDDPTTALITAVALNNSGQVAVNANGKAYRWSSSEGAVALAPDAIGSRAIQMNDNGQVVGVLAVKDVENGQPPIEQAFVTRRYGTLLIMLGAAGDGNTPTDINNWSQIVGTKPVNGQSHGYVTPPLFVTRSIDLDALEEIVRDGWSNLRPAAINDHGQIAGTATRNATDLAFLLTPRSVFAYLPNRKGKQPRCYSEGTQQLAESSTPEGVLIAPDSTCNTVSLSGDVIWKLQCRDTRVMLAQYSPTASVSRSVFSVHLQHTP